MKSHRIKILLILVLLSKISYGQELLTKEEAVKMALEFNYDIKVANNNVQIASNDADIKNSGYLPTVTATAGIDYTDTKVERDDDEGFAFNANGNVVRVNSSVEINYTIFDGLERRYTFTRLKQNSILSELQAQQIIEQAIVQLFSSYYEVARLTENEISQKQSLEVSKKRLQRANYSYEYGQSTQLDVLNAEVDVNTDSINYLTIIQQLENTKRDLNLLMGRDVNSRFEVDTAVTYQRDLDIKFMEREALSKNVTILQANSQIQASEYDIRINKAGWIPKVGAIGSYGRTRTNYESSAFSDLTTTGPTAGLNLTWNIYDGGKTSTRVQNAKIALDNERILKERAQQQLYRDLNNAWTDYQTALFVLGAQRKNLETNQRNFDRTLEQNRLGQVTSIEFRQAQLNLLNARLSENEAKYTAKNAELALLQLSGNLLETNF